MSVAGPVRGAGGDRSVWLRQAGDIPENCNLTHKIALSSPHDARRMQGERGRASRSKPGRATPGSGPAAINPHGARGEGWFPESGAEGGAGHGAAGSRLADSRALRVTGRDGAMVRGGQTADWNAFPAYQPSLAGSRGRPAATAGSVGAGAAWRVARSPVPSSRRRETRPPAGLSASRNDTIWGPQSR